VFPLDSLESCAKLGAVAVMNEEAKLKGDVECNRTILLNGEAFGSFYGPFFICGVDGEDFSPISLEQEVYYKNKFDTLICNFGKEKEHV